MLFCESAGDRAKAIEDLAVLASQLDALGIPACIDGRDLPPGLSRNAHFDLAPWLRDGDLGAGDSVILAGAQDLSENRLTRLRRLARPGGISCRAFGRFESNQRIIGLRARLSYVFGEDPEILALPEQPEDPVAWNRDFPVFGVVRQSPLPDRPRLLLAGPDLDDPAQARALTALALSSRFRVAVLVNGKAKQAWISAHGHQVTCYHYAELLPVDLAERVDIFAAFSPPAHHYRLQSLIANLAVSGVTLIDGTAEHRIAAGNDAFIRGPVDIAPLDRFLTGEILPNLKRIAADTSTSQAARRYDAAPVIRFLGQETEPEPSVARPANEPSDPGPDRGVTFMPTNGVGLGHAQRCALIASELSPGAGKPSFAVFPSCMGLVRTFGFDAMPLISRSRAHAQSHENDLANYLRLLALTAPGGTLVFDGGYVFDSVYRTILKNRLTGIWIRRGLWQAGQDNSTSLDREKIFARVIVPHEAFGETERQLFARGPSARGRPGGTAD